MTIERQDEEQENDPRLLNIAKAVSDGLPVDWEGASEEEPKTRRLLERLRFLQAVADAHRRMLEAEADHREE